MENIQYEDFDALIEDVGKHPQEQQADAKLLDQIEKSRAYISQREEFLGTNPQMSEVIKAMEQNRIKSLEEGSCHDCGKKVPGKWPEDGLPKDWTCYTYNDSDNPAFIICPNCEEDFEDVGDFGAP